MSRFILAPYEFDSPLRVKFGHASAIREKTQTILVLAYPASHKFDAGQVGIGESCPREYVTGESKDSVLEFISASKADLESKVFTLADLRNWLKDNTARIDSNPAAFAAIEGALVDFFARQHKVTLEEFLGLPMLRNRFEYSAVLGDARPWKFWLQAALYWVAGFRDFKVKISGDLDRDRRKFAILTWLQKISKIRLRADANNLWPDAQSCIDFMGALETRFWAIEEPVRAGDHLAQAEIARELSAKIILDESLLRIDQLAQLGDFKDMVIANIRVSKNGGLLRSIAMAQTAVDMGIPLIFGAHVGETSVLTRSGLAVASCFSDQVVAQEGGFGRLLIKQDAVSPSLRFGWGGAFRPEGSLHKNHVGSGLLIAPDILNSVKRRIL